MYLDLIIIIIDGGTASTIVAASKMSKPQTYNIASHHTTGKNNPMMVTRGKLNGGKPLIAHKSLKHSSSRTRPTKLSWFRCVKINYIE